MFVPRHFNVKHFMFAGFFLNILPRSCFSWSIFPCFLPVRSADLAPMFTSCSSDPCLVLLLGFIFLFPDFCPFGVHEFRTWSARNMEISVLSDFAYLAFFLSRILPPLLSPAYRSTSSPSVVLIYEQVRPSASPEVVRSAVSSPFLRVFERGR